MVIELAKIDSEFGGRKANNSDLVELIFRCYITFRVHFRYLILA